MNVSRASITASDPVLVENGLKLGFFFAWEVLYSRQLLGRPFRNVNNGIAMREKPKDKSILVKFYRIFRTHAAFFTLSILSCIFICLLLIRLLLLKSGIEPNPGPDNESQVDFCLLSQNCRGLTDRQKVIRLLRKIYPGMAKSKRISTIACLQETHTIDRFAVDAFFKGHSIIDDGERNQRGVCILVPDAFEISDSLTSGYGRWAIAVAKPKLLVTSHRVVIASIYAPNCHREARTFYQEFFNQLDNLTDGIISNNGSYEIILSGDFNVVLQANTGALNRIRSNTESELANLIIDAMEHRELIQPLDHMAGNCYTWRRGNCFSKLDYVYLSRSLANKIVKAETIWHEFGARYDHAALRVQIKNTADTQRGRSFPKVFSSDIASELDRAWLKDQLLQSEAQIPAHWDPHMRLDFIKTMLRSKALELRQMRKFTDSSVSIKEKINGILSNSATDAQLTEVEHLRLKLNEAEEKEAEILKLKAGVKWREEGEKSTSYFLSRFKANIEGSTMHSIRLLDRIVRGSTNILSVVRQFYQALYNSLPPAKLGDDIYCDEFFAHCPKLELDQRRILARPLDLIELKESLKTCSDSAPGLDGIPYSYYSAFSDCLLKYILDSWNYAIATGSLAESHRRSCITLLPKKGKDLTLISNWRPISLSDCDLKIITKAYANRLKVVLPDILCDAQAAYVPGRDISFNNRLIQYARTYANSNGKDFCIVSLDAKKAFDSVSHEYLTKVLEVYDFPPEFIAVFKTLYAQLESVVQVNGFLSPAFKIRNGVKQGDALSCGLFVLAMDPLLRNLIENRHIQGLDIPVGPNESVEIKVLSYADDVTIVCRNPQLQSIFDEYNRFSLVSGLVLNAEKTEVFNIIRSPHGTSRIRYLDKDYQLDRVEQIRICGIWLTRDLEAEYQLNIMARIRSMEATVMGWGRRFLTMNGRMILAKTFLLSLIVFPAQALAIRKKESKKIERLIYSFVNGARSLYGPERIARNTLKAARARGGINGVDVEAFLTALAVKQYGKASVQHRVLGKLQSSYEVSCGVTRTARAALRANYRKLAVEFSVPDIRQIPLVSALPVNILLLPGTAAANIAMQLDISSLGCLQEAFINGRRRADISTVLKSIPKPFAALIRTSTLIQVHVQVSWLNSHDIVGLASISTKLLKLYLWEDRFPTSGPDIRKIYKRADWPPPDCEVDSTFKGIWDVKNPTLRAIRLKVLYKDIFSNERRHRFGLTDSPECTLCGQVESVEHHLFLCANASRIWSLFHKLTGIRMVSLFDVIRCDRPMEIEIVKSVLIKALLQIDRSTTSIDRVLTKECVLFLKIEAKANRNKANALVQYADRLAAVM